MPIPKRKNPFCLNCKYPLADSDNYCPSCGQENNDRLVSFWELVKEVFGNIFSYDSQFIRSIVPFLFRPGYLTNQFLAGKRKTYIQPIRLYFATSFLFFLVYTNQINLININFNKDFDQIALKDSVAKDSLKFKNIKSLEDEEDSLSNNETTKKPDKKVTGFNDKGNLFQKFFSKKNQKLIKEEKLNAGQLLDTLKLEKTFVNKLLARQSIRIVNEGGTEEFLNYAIGKLPVMMFVLMPIVALILKILYLGIFSRSVYFIKYLWRLLFHISHKTVYMAAKSARLNIGIADPMQSEKLSFTFPRRYYIEHLIFTLHLHAFIFFCFVLIYLFLQIDLKAITIGLLWLAGIWMVVYIWVSFKKVYKEHWFKTFLKIFALLIAYASSLVTCFLFLLLVSLLLF